MTYMTQAEYDALTPELKAVWDDGYNVSEDEKNPYNPGTEYHRVWQLGFDESMFCNVQNIDPAKVRALGYGHLLPDAIDPDDKVEHPERWDGQQ